jgi:FtsZ-binding cell division protein ZapB
LKEEVEALKKMNSGLNNKVKELSKQPSAQPVNTNAKPTNNNSYSAWREQMRSMIG